MDDGCTVAGVWGARRLGTSFPRWRVTRKSGPSSACAAVAPRHTRICGLISSISLSSHGKQAATSRAFGFLWIRRFRLAVHLKCLTTFVTYVSAGAVSPSPQSGIFTPPPPPPHRAPPPTSSLPPCSPHTTRAPTPPPAPPTRVAAHP